MGLGFYLSVAMFPVMIILTVIFFLRGKIKNDETEIYGGILFTSVVMTGLEILSALLYKTIFGTFIYNIVAKMVLIGYISVNFLFCKYLMTVCKKSQNSFKVLYFLTIITLVITLLSVIEYVDNNGSVAPTGIPVVLTFGYAICLGTYQLILTIVNRKAIIAKKFTPFYLFLFFGLINGLILFFYPASFMVGYIWCLTIIIMYFTIENPDMKLLKELHNSKKISDSANEEKTMFLYNMTQEIRNITGKIDDDADVILDSKNWEETYDSARDIKANTSKFTNMTNEILDVSSIDAGSIKIYNSKYNIKNVLRQIVNVYGDLCRDKDLKFITNIDHDIPEVLYGDSISLKEVLNTILSNSAKYTNKGYVELSVNTIIKNDICRLIITIEDSGVGIKSEDINKIKVNNESLSKANRLITTMNGAMMISSDYGVGTKVKIILDQKMEVEANSETSKYEDVFKDTNVLMVDDSEAGLKIIDKLLKGTKVKVDVAQNGKECIDKIRVGKYDLILLDEELSQISGKELMGKIKEIRNFNIPVILLTKDNSYEYNEESKKIGFSDYIIKPIKKDGLLEKINKNIKSNKKIS